MNDYKNIFGVLAMLIQLASYLVYLWAMYKGQAKPHAFTWFVWGTISIIGFAAVLVAGGAEGAWVLLINVVACYVIAGIAFWQKRIVYDKYDWMALIGALIGTGLWWITKNPLYAVVLISLSDAIGFIPSFRKAYKLPFDDNALSFAIGIVTYIFSISALESLTLTTSLYQFTIIAVDAAFVTLVLARRKQLAK